MLNHGFKRSHADHCLYTKKAEDGRLIVLVLYMDDMLLARKHKETLNALKKELNSAFSMKDLGAAENILGMRIKRDKKKRLLFLSQDKYIKKVDPTLVKMVDNPIAEDVDQQLRDERDEILRLLHRELESESTCYTLPRTSIALGLGVAKPEPSQQEAIRSASYQFAPNRGVRKM
ncbi:hypothetical protein L7F22_007460 [Adiantum nelumboides]|nr:hypothetical protein [Adiantum nelumboides]